MARVSSRPSHPVSRSRRPSCKPLVAVFGHGLRGPIPRSGLGPSVTARLQRHALLGPTRPSPEATGEMPTLVAVDTSLGRRRRTARLRPARLAAVRQETRDTGALLTSSLTALRAALPAVGRPPACRPRPRQPFGEDDAADKGRAPLVAAPAVLDIKFVSSPPLRRSSSTAALTPKPVCLRPRLSQAVVVLGNSSVVRT